MKASTKTGSATMPPGTRTPGRNQEARILVVDDEDAIGDLVATTLRYEGFEVETALSGRDGLRKVVEFAPDVLVLDVMLGDLDGFEVLRRLRGDGHLVPVLFLTAADSTEDRVRGLTLGGDDYVCKPFSLAELVARVRVILRRSAHFGATGGLTVADLELNLDSLEVKRAGVHIDLTPTEFKLLRYLMENAGRVLSKEQIVDHVWNYDFDGDTNIVETYISYLRRKVDASGPPLVTTVRGFGYTIRAPRS